MIERLFLPFYIFIVFIIIAGVWFIFSEKDDE
ncbi:hypothetical protein UFOVP254_14 [uncultured Caudovirales phage]|uniref:Uncharacterized protein n=1 Tax=uncultured Caudovirales phage TaxID=2100421 RepID=A0A6J5LIJ6_9CAUD|nr:hypothetical protein UFOVP76_39 [uncultured Caudovirales phage]CAB4132907.1 hypothetical protein UFOVP254_14 [uncultured Caudovirales phage]